MSLNVSDDDGDDDGNIEVENVAVTMTTWTNMTVLLVSPPELTS